MTKQWEMYEATIKTLYAENTLSVVRQLMIEKTRAYRGRLIRWGIRKYNCRKRASSASSVNDGGFSSVSDPASPTVGSSEFAPAAAHHNTARQQHVEMGRRDLALPDQMGQQYGAVESSHQSQNYSTDDPYGSKANVLVSPSQSSSSIQYDEWNAVAHPLDNTNGNENHDHDFTRHNDVVVSPPYFSGYTQMAPPLTSNGFTTTAVAATGASYDGIAGCRQSLYRTPPQQQGHGYDGAAG